MTEPRYSSRIPLLVLLPLVVVGIVWFLPGGQIPLQEHRQGDFPLPKEAKAIRLELDVGDVQILGGPADKVSFEANTLRVAQDQEAFAVLSGQDFTLNGELDPSTQEFVLSTPPFPSGLDVEYEGRNKEGDRIKMTGSRGMRQFNVRLVVPTTLPLKVVCRLGSVEVRDLAAVTTIRTGRGTIRMKAPTASSKVHTESGDIIVDQHRAALDVFTGKGDMLISLMEVLKPIKLRGRDGTIRVAVPAHAAFNLTARTVDGSVVNGLGLPRLKFGEKGGQLKGTIGSGGPMVDIETAKGLVSVLVE